MNIIADFHEDFINLIFEEINNLKQIDFHFDDFSEWKPKRIDSMNKIIELRKSKGDDFSFESDALDEKILTRDYRRDMVHLYFNLQHKIPAEKPRKIFKCSSFSCPKELESGLTILENKIDSGENLLPHLSRKIFDPGFSDYMFYDYGLTHFHLGTKQSIKNSLLIEGTKEIVYALLNETSCYFIRIDEHGKWDDVALLEDLKKDFPEVLDPWKISGEPLWKPTKEERRNMLRSQINSYIEIGGENYIGPGMGIDGVGTSSLAVMKMDHWFQHYARIQKAIVTMLEKHLDQIEADIGCKLKDMDLILQKFEPIIVYDKTNELYIDFDPKIGSMTIRSK
jgi:hypothetical protein